MKVEVKLLRNSCISLIDCELSTCSRSVCWFSSHSSSWINCTNIIGRLKLCLHKADSLSSGNNWRVRFTYTICIKISCGIINSFFTIKLKCNLISVCCCKLSCFNIKGGSLCRCSCSLYPTCISLTCSTFGCICIGLTINSNLVTIISGFLNFCCDSILSCSDCIFLTTDCNLLTIIKSACCYLEGCSCCTICECSIKTCIMTLHINILGCSIRVAL